MIKGWREGGREGGRVGGREGEREGGMSGERKRGTHVHVAFNNFLIFVPISLEELIRS